MTDTPERTPAEELRAAAEWLRKFAHGTTRGPWVHHRTITRNDENDYAWTICRPICEQDSGECDPDCGANVLTTGAEGCEEDNVTEVDASWIALVHPGLAEPLAVWLEDGAKHYEAYVESHGRDIAERVVYHGISVARVLNGGAA